MLQDARSEKISANEGRAFPSKDQPETVSDYPEFGFWERRSKKFGKFGGPPGLKPMLALAGEGKLFRKQTILQEAVEEADWRLTTTAPKHGNVAAIRALLE